jgi:hypothetical protein
MRKLSKCWHIWQNQGVIYLLISGKNKLQLHWNLECLDLFVCLLIIPVCMVHAWCSQFLSYKCRNSLFILNYLQLNIVLIVSGLFSPVVMSTYYWSKSVLKEHVPNQSMPYLQLLHWYSLQMTGNLPNYARLVLISSLIWSFLWLVIVLVCYRNRTFLPQCLWKTFCHIDGTTFASQLLCYQPNH